MTKQNKKQAKELVMIVKNTANHLNVMRIRLEEIAGDNFMDASCSGQALGEEVRLFDGGNERLAQAEHLLLEALAFYGELLGENFLGEEKAEGGDDRRAAAGKKSPTGGEVATCAHARGRAQRGEV